MFIVYAIKEPYGTVRQVLIGHEPLDDVPDMEVIPLVGTSCPISAEKHRAEWVKLLEDNGHRVQDQDYFQKIPG